MISRTLASTLALLLLSSSLAGQGFHTLYTLDGQKDHDLLGISVDGLGDVTGDGKPDFLVGAYESNKGTGEIKVFSGATGALHAKLLGDSQGDGFGCAVAGAGDINLDGVPDLIVGAYRDDDTGTDAGTARVYSGRDFRLLYTFYGAAAGDECGTAVAGAGDVNRDGYADLIVGAPCHDANGTDSGSVEIYSGRTGKLLRSFVGDSAHDWFGYAVNGAGDVDRDGYADVIIGACYNDTSGWFNNGSAFVYSGRTGQLLHEFHGDGTSDWCGLSVDGVGDINLDGFDDLIVGASANDKAGIDAGMATIFDGRSGRVLRRFYGVNPGDEFGVAVRGCGDFDRDGIPDVVVGAYRGSTLHPAGGSVYVFSGRNGRVILTCEGESADNRLGVSVGGVGDANGDGHMDVIAGAVYSDRGGQNAGTARVFSGATLSLMADPTTLPLLEGGVQTLRLDAGRTHRGRNYWVLGSASGTSPSTYIGSGVTLPIRWDAYSSFTASQANGEVLVNFRGTLDGDGRATATLNLPAQLDTGVFSTTIYHAFFVYDSRRVYMASNPVTLTQSK